MEEKKTPNTIAAQEDYARQLAGLSVRVCAMTQEQRERNAEKIAELRRRIQALPEDLYEIYAQEAHALGGEPEPRTPPSARGKRQRDYEEPEYDDVDDNAEDEYDSRGRKKKPRKHHGCLIVFLVLLLIPLIAAGCGYFWLKAEVAGSRGEVITQTVSIKKGASLTQIGQQLEQSGVIQSGMVFRLYVRSQEGVADTLQYGTFEMTSDMSYEDIIHVLQEANVYRQTVRVTFPEGNTVIQYAQIMEEAGLCSAQEFLAVANYQDFSQFRFWEKRGNAPNVFMRAEGYLFPDTYEFFVGDNAYNMVAKLYEQFDNKITDEMYARMEELDMTLSEVITLASLVQEEAGNEYSKTVSAVFHNRLNDEMTLGSNVAWNKEKANDNNYIYDWMAGPYGYGDWNSIPEAMREAYDTYDHEGLPAGPVSNPGLLAIEAALWPEENCDYFYFQTDTLGNYHFARTNAEHEQITAELEQQGIRP